jgi:hypothetical protein
MGEGDPVGHIGERGFNGLRSGPPNKNLGPNPRTL